jgi:hypothetical protein
MHARTHTRIAPSPVFPPLSLSCSLPLTRNLPSHPFLSLACPPTPPPAAEMDPVLVKGLREAKQLLDDGILSPGEFEKEKQVLLQKRDLRVQREAARAREDPERRFRSDGANNTFCSRCGRPGHNKRSCTEEESALGPKKRRKKYRYPDDLANGKRGPPKPRWSREPTCYALFFGSGACCTAPAAAAAAAVCACLPARPRPACATRRGLGF